MKLFINEGIWERDWYGLIGIKELSDSRLKLTMPNYLEKVNKHEKVRFVFSNISVKDLERDILLNNISLRKSGKNTYNFIHSIGYHEDYMYAFLRSTGKCADDVFIPASMKDKVEVIRKISFVNDEVDYGDFLSNVYFIKIKLEIKESLPVYLTSSNPRVLEEHYVFFRTDWGVKDYHVSEKLKTFILLNEKNKKEFISLSTLCE